MGSVPLCLLLSLTALVAAVPEDEDEYTWPRRKVPLLRSEQVVRLSGPAFAGEPQDDLRGACGIECQSALPRPSPADLESFLSYETVYENGTRTLTRVSVGSPAEDAPRNASGPHPRRARRQVYGTDSRFTISDRQFSTAYPFSTTVRVSTGCSGILVSPTHVLTAAHCIHDGQDYLKGAKRLRVGVLSLRSKRRGGRRKGRRKGRGGRGEEKGEQEGRGEGEGEGEGKGERAEEGERDEKGRRGEGEAKGERQGRGGKRRGRKNRGRRSAEAEVPAFRWTRVKQTQVPQGWLQGPSGKSELSADYDYALLEMKRPHGQKFMDLGLVPSVRRLPAGRVHFSGFDDDRPGQLVYRFCSVTEESGDLLYQRCDSQPGAGGSGVYVRLKEPGERKWKRKVIGVFSGHRWVDVDGTRRDYNVAVRITPEKYAQICHWVHGNSEECRSA